MSLARSWPLLARAEQIPNDTTQSGGTWSTWLYLAGRGSGKTRACAEWVNDKALRNPGCRIAIVARTAGDVRDTAIRGESGIIATAPDGAAPIYTPSVRTLVWPNGSIGQTFSAEKPDLLRGPQFDFAWADELASWQYLEEAWSNLEFCLRLGDNPQCVVSTTPRPVKLLKEMLSDPATITTRSSTDSNAANLPPATLARWNKKYEGTRLGRQELGAEILEDVEGALWSMAAIDGCRIATPPEQYERVVVAVDPAVSNTEASCEHGIVVVGKVGDHYYVLDDLSMTGGPLDWGARAVSAYRSRHADRVIGEVNNGGDLVEANIRSVDKTVSYRAVRASRGKYKRAEPVAALYEQGRVHHVGAYATLEDQMIAFVPAGGGLSNGESPDRLDALVWGLTELAELDREYEEPAPPLMVW